MQISKKDLPLSQLAPFCRLRLFDFHDHLARCKYLTSGFHKGRADFAITIVRCPNTETSIGLDQHAVAGYHVFAGSFRCEAHTIFVCFDLLWNPDLHCNLPLWTTFLIERGFRFPANLPISRQIL